MNLLKGLTKAVLSPLKGLSEVVEDMKGDNDCGAQALSIGTFGISSIVKGTAKGLKKGIDEIFEKED